MINLDTKNRIQRISTVYRGSVNSAQVRIGESFKDAIRLNSAALIIVHCHPSGDPTPSPEDLLVTRQIGAAARRRLSRATSAAAVGGVSALDKNAGAV